MSSEFDDTDLEKIDLYPSADKDNPAKEADDADRFSEDDTDAETSSNLPKIVQIVIISFIIIVLLASIVILVRWQRGHAPDATDNNDVAAYAVESEDFLAPFDPTTIDGYVDDEELNIAILGDDFILHKMGDNGISDMIAKSTGANVTTLALPGSTIGIQDLSYSPEHPEDAYSLFYIISAICAGDMGDYSLLFSALSEIEDNSIYYNYWDEIHKIDFDKIDTLILCYGYSDYVKGRTLVAGDVYSEQLYGHENGTAGALDDCLFLLNERFPYMQVIVVSPSFCFVENENGEMEGVDVCNTGAGTMGDYVIHMKVVSETHQVSFVDNYFFEGFNYASYEDYLEEEGAYPNEVGRKLIADHITPFIYTGN